MRSSSPARLARVAAAASCLAAPLAAGAQLVSFAGATVCATTTPWWRPESPLTGCYGLEIRSYSLPEHQREDGTVGWTDVLEVRVASLQGRDPRDNTTFNGLQRATFLYDPTPASTGGTTTGDFVGGEPVNGATVTDYPLMPAEWWVQTTTGSPRDDATAFTALPRFGIAGCFTDLPPDPDPENVWSGIDGSTCAAGSFVRFALLRLDPPVPGLFDASLVRAFDIESRVWDGLIWEGPFGLTPSVSFASCATWTCEVHDFRAGKVPMTAAPEPATVVLVGGGLLGLCALRRGRGKRGVRHGGGRAPSRAG